MKTVIYCVIVGLATYTLGYLCASYPDGEGEMASLQQPQSIVTHLDGVSIDMPENYMQMSVDKEHQDTLIGWYDVDADTVHLKFIVNNNLGAILADTQVNPTEAYDTSISIGGRDTVCDPSP